VSINIILQIQENYHFYGSHKIQIFPIYDCNTTLRNFGFSVSEKLWKMNLNSRYSCWTKCYWNNFSPILFHYFYKSPLHSFSIVIYLCYGQNLIPYLREWLNKLRKTRQAMYEWRNIEARLCNYCCSGKAINITYSEFVFVALGVEYAMRMHHVVICGLSCSVTLFHFIS